MNKKLRRTTTNLPAQLLEQAQKATGRGITETIIEGLTLVRRSRAAQLANDLIGKVSFKFNAEESRERSRR
jgi:hypothetical protein